MPDRIVVWCAIAGFVGIAIGTAVACAFYEPRLELAQARVEQLANDVREQNSAITRLHDDGEKRKAQAAKAIAGAVAARSDHERLAAELMAAQPSGDDCQAIDALLTKGLGQ